MSEYVRICMNISTYLSEWLFLSKGTIDCFLEVTKFVVFFSKAAKVFDLISDLE